jgi:RNA polymerase sigma-70 factor (family 1)
MSGFIAINTAEETIQIKAIILGDKRIFETLYKRHYRELFAVAFRYMGTTEAAEEVVHDVFINIWNKADQLNIKVSLKSYLVKSVVNTSLNVLKKAKAEGKKELAYVSDLIEPDDNEMGDETKEALLNSLELALNLLPDRCREVMYLSRFSKLKQQEIALQMNISVKTVKNHLTYGFKKLREEMEKHMEILIILFMSMITHL